MYGGLEMIRSKLERSSGVTGSYKEPCRTSIRSAWRCRAAFRRASSTASFTNSVATTLAVRMLPGWPDATGARVSPGEEEPFEIAESIAGSDRPDQARFRSLPPGSPSLLPVSSPAPSVEERRTRSARAACSASCIRAAARWGRSMRFSKAMETHAVPVQRSRIRAESVVAASRRCPTSTSVSVAGRGIMVLASTSIRI